MSTILSWFDRDAAIGFGVFFGIMGLGTLFVVIFLGAWNPHYGECSELTKGHISMTHFCMDYVSEHPGTTGQEILDVYATEKAAHAKDVLERAYAP